MDIPKNPILNLVYVYFKRLLILLVIIVIGDITVYEVFKYFDSKTPLLVAVLLTYISFSYILIPYVIRIYRRLKPPKHIPEFTTTPDGFKCDPVNIVIIGSFSNLRKSMLEAGWHTADDKNLRNVFKYAKCILLKRSYPNAPFSSLFLFGRKQDIGFQKQLNNSVLHRHHVRFWAVGFHEKNNFWRQKIKYITDQEQLWVGAAIMDIGTGIIRYHGQVTHKIDKNIDEVRDLIVADLQSKSLVKDVYEVKAHSQMRTKNRVLGCEMVTDQNLKVVELK